MSVFSQPDTLLEALRQALRAVKYPRCSRDTVSFGLVTAVRLGWQVHPAGLVDASLSAIPDEDPEERPSARAHPIGRNVAVNWVYDLRRGAVVAIYGAAWDFRPFVELFLYSAS
jgi:hypothetical protein